MGKRIHRIGLKQIGSRAINLGYVGENLHTRIVIDCTELFDEYPDAVASLKVRPPRGELYQPVITETDGVITWELLDSELQTDGSGQYQLTFTSGTEIIKSAVGGYIIHNSLRTN